MIGETDTVSVIRLSYGLSTCFNATEWEVKPEDIDAIWEQLANMEFAGDRSINGDVAP